VAATCRHCDISRATFYKWEHRFKAEGADGLRERPKAPKNSPNATNSEVVGKIIYLRQNYHFGPQKIAMYLKRYHDVTISDCRCLSDIKEIRAQSPSHLTAL
jgi:transposase